MSAVDGRRPAYRTALWGALSEETAPHRVARVAEIIEYLACRDSDLLTEVFDELSASGWSSVLARSITNDLAAALAATYPRADGLTPCDPIHFAETWISGLLEAYGDASVDAQDRVRTLAALDALRAYVQPRPASLA